MNTVSIVDYGMGNIYSISNAVRQIGFEPKLVQSADELAHSSKVILPGVGAYRDAMHVLNEMQLCDAVREHATRGRHLLGICLGMQLLLESSEENGGVPGLGIVNGDVRRFAPLDGYKIPQIQWNAVSPAREMEMFDEIPHNSMFYFLHSFYCAPEGDEMVCAYSHYAGSEYCSAFQIGNVWATQFHPEKSGGIGLQLLANFLSQE